MRIEQRSWERRPYEPPRSDDDDGSPAVTVLGMILAVALFGAAIWGIVEILYMQEAIDWYLEIWQAGLLSFIYLLWRALVRAMWPD